ncbi:sugar phosphate isomerase/epimerase family protein [Paenibacillus sp. y28]|uniref:sugar phosphate isomerase/epimerase family protein n=1 Tax=Paenibacillus sp. y28 TaxID=3129110 RepID=UPI003017CBFE
MKLSVFTVATPDLTPEELAAAAKQAGIDGVEWRYKEIPAELQGENPSFWRNNLCTMNPAGDEAHLDRFRRAAADNGLTTVSVTPYLTAGDVEGTEKVLGTAAKLGAGFIRVGVPGYDRSRHFNELFELERRYLQDIVPLCKQYGVKGLVETHHVTIAASASAAYRLVEGLDPDAIGILYDPGNMVHEGFENYRMGLELLGPYLAHVHVKNGTWRPELTEEDGSTVWKSGWSPIKHGMVPWRQVIQDLQAVGYDGYLGVEDFSGTYSSKDMLRHFASYIRSLL